MNYIKMLLLNIVFSSLVFAVIPMSATYEELQKLTLTGGGYIGSSVTLDGDTLVIGLPNKDVDAYTSAGAVYVYKHDNVAGRFEQIQELTVPMPLDYDNFGQSVAVSGDIIAVGLKGDYLYGYGFLSGAVYTYKRNIDGLFEQTTKLTTDNADLYKNGFGSKIVLDGDKLLAGNAAGFYTYEADAATGLFTRILETAGMSIYNIALEDNRLVVGKPYEDNGALLGAGVTYIYDYDMSTGDYVEKQKLLASDAMDEDHFGNKVAINGDTLIVATSNTYGSLYDTNLTGSVYVYRLDVATGLYQEGEKLTSATASLGDGFAADIAISGNQLIIGASGKPGYPNYVTSPAVYIYERSSESDIFTQTFMANPNPGEELGYGKSVTIGSRAGVVGSKLFGYVYGNVPTVDPYVLWHNSSTGAVKLMGVSYLTPGEVGSVIESSNTNLIPKGLADFTGEGGTDILFHNQNSGMVRVWKMDGLTRLENIQVLASSNTNLKIVGVEDFDGDGDPDIATFNTNSGALIIWVMDGTTKLRNETVLTGANVNLLPRGVGDMNNDGIPDIILRNSNSGAVRIWTMNGDFTRNANLYVTGSSNTNLELRGIVDINKDGNKDILNYNTNSGTLRAWLMDGSMHVIDNAFIVQEPNLNWSVREGFLESASMGGGTGFDFSTMGTNPDGLIYPNGGEVWIYDQNETITWDTSKLTGPTMDFYILFDDPSDLNDFSVDLTTLLAAKMWSLFGAGVSNTGSYEVNPRDLNGIGNAYVILAVSSDDKWDVSDSTITLTDTPTPTPTPTPGP